MGRRRRQDGTSSLVAMYLTYFLLLTGFSKQTNGHSIENGQMKLTNPVDDLSHNVRTHHRNTYPPDFQHKTRRKRGVYYDDSEEEEDIRKCLVIQSMPVQQRVRSLAPLNLMDLLNNGSNTIAQEVTINDAILVMGTRGSGKAMLIQMLTKDLGGLIAGLTRSGKMVIIDTYDGIKMAPTTSSKLIPELVMQVGSDNGTATAFYDFPDFDSNQSPEQDIAVNYFMKRTLSILSRIKIIFAIPHKLCGQSQNAKSGTVGQNSQDLDYLVTKASNFGKDVPKYSKVFGLVVTKVNDYDDTLAMSGIVQFLTTYLDNLRSQLDLNSTLVLKEPLERKIQFVEVLMEQDEQDKYVRIRLSRSPTECGPLSHSREATDAKDGITELYSETLEYVQVNLLDFGDMLADKSKLLVMDYLSTVNEEVTTRLKDVMEEFKSWHDNMILKAPDLVNKTKKMVAATEIFGKILTSFTNFETNSTSEKLMEGVVQSLGELGFNVSRHDQQNVTRNLSHLTFFEEVTATPTTIFTAEWKLLIENVNFELEKEETATKESLKSHVILMNPLITMEVTSLLSNFTDFCLDKISQTTEWRVKLELIHNATEALEESIFFLYIFEGQDDLEDYANSLIALLDKLGFYDYTSFQEDTREAQVYFQYDDSVNPSGVPRAMEDWVTPVKKLMRRFQHLEETTALSLTIYERDTEIAGLVKEVESLNSQLATEIENSEQQASEIRLMEERYMELNNKIGSLKNETKLNHELIKKQAADNKLLLKENGELRNGIFEKLRRLETYNLLKFMNANLNSGLHLAIMQKDWQSLKILIGLNENVNLQNKNGETPLILSAAYGDTNAITIVKYLIDHGASVDFTDLEGQTFLHKLVANGTLLQEPEFRDIAEYIVSNNVSSLFNVRDSNGITPLMLAAKNIQIDNETLSLLLRNEVDVTLVDDEARSLRYYINRGNRNLELLSELPQLGTSDVMELNVAIRLMNEDAIKILIKIGEDANSLDNGSLTSLHLAAGSNNTTFALSAIKLLLKNGANAMAVDGEGQVFLHKLVTDGTTLTASEFQDLVGLMVSRNVSTVFNVQDITHGRTPLMSAVKNIFIDGSLLSLLLMNDVDVNLLDKIGNPLDFYVLEGGRNQRLLPDLRAIWEKSGSWMVTLSDNNGDGSKSVGVTGSNNCFSLGNRELCSYGNSSCVAAVSNTKSMNTRGKCVRLYSASDCRETPMMELLPGTSCLNNWKECEIQGKVESVGSCPSTSLPHGSNILSLTGGFITSTNFPNNYNNAENRYWSVTVPYGKKVRLTFENFTENGYDKLTITELLSQEVIKVAQGSGLPSPLVSKSNQVRLHFRSDGGTVYRGFKLRWESCVGCTSNYNG